MTLRNIAKLFLASVALTVAFACASLVASHIASVADNGCRHAYTQHCEQHFSVATFDNVPCAPASNVIRIKTNCGSTRTDAQHHHDLSKYHSAEVTLLRQVRYASNAFAPSRPALNVIWPIFLHHLII